jgi:peptide/nickel transport system ATP-binding protein
MSIHPGPAGGTAALRGLDLEVEAGSVTAVVGPSGSGKTSLLRILAGDRRPDAGTVEVFGLRLERASPSELRAYRRDTVAAVDQHYRRALSPYLPAHEIAGLALAVRGVGRRSREARVAALLEAVGLEDRAHARTAELSGGEQQRLAIAAALSTRPRLLLADEPTGELDAATTDGLLRVLRDAVRAEGATAVVVTHDAAVEAVAHRVLVLQDGRAVAIRDGRPGTAEAALVDTTGWRAPEVTWRHADPAPARQAVVAGEPARAAGSDPAPAVVLDAVHRRYAAVRGAGPGIGPVTARVPDRGLHLVVGPSGSGKSTLLRLVAGLDRPDAGRVVVLGTDLSTLDRERLAGFRSAGVGLAEQARGLVPFLDVRENLALAAGLRRDGDPAVLDGAADRIASTLAAVGIDHLAARRPAELSAGERTRATIARALVGAPRLLLLDEPTATLDRVNSAAVARLLRDLAERLTVVVATHDPALLEAGVVRVDLAPAGAGGATAKGAATRA